MEATTTPASLLLPPEVVKVFRRHHTQRHEESAFAEKLLTTLDFSAGQPQNLHEENAFAGKMFLGASVGNLRAIRELGRCFEHAIGVANDQKSAVALYQTAADK